MNFSLALMSGKIKGVKVNADSLVNTGAQANATSPGASDPERTLSVLEASRLAGEVPKQTHDAIIKQLQNPAEPQAEPKPAVRKSNKPPALTSNTGTIAGLSLCSPDFQIIG